MKNGSEWTSGKLLGFFDKNIYTVQQQALKHIIEEEKYKMRSIFISLNEENARIRH